MAKLAKSAIVKIARAVGNIFAFFNLSESTATIAAAKSANKFKSEINDMVLKLVEFKNVSDAEMSP